MPSWSSLRASPLSSTSVTAPPVLRSSSLLTDLLRQSCSDAARHRHLGDIVQQVPNDLMARCGDAHTLSLLNERTNHSSAGEGFAGTGRTLNSQHRVVEFVCDTDRELHRRLRYRGRRMEQCEASEDPHAAAAERASRRHRWQHARQSERSRPRGPRSTHDCAQRALLDASPRASFLYAYPASARSGLPARTSPNLAPSVSFTSSRARISIS